MSSSRRRIGSVLAVCAALFAPEVAVAQLREARMAAPAPLASSAAAVNSRVVQLHLPENPYRIPDVESPKLFRVTSPDDPAFANGVHPTKVRYRHWPETAWYRDTEIGNIANINVHYRVFLELPVAMKAGKSYRVEADKRAVPAGFADTFQFRGKEPNDVIHVNQVAYLASGPKVAYLSLWTGNGSVKFDEAKSFRLVDEKTNQTAFEGKVALAVDEEREFWSGSHVYALDFTGATRQGRFYLDVDGVGRSYSFDIGERAFDAVGYTLFRGLTLQRDGNHGLTPKVTQWHRPPAHLDDAIDERSGKRVDLVGGHMDAGDRGKYPHNGADATAALLSVMALYPAAIETIGESLQIPESGNGVPDVVDETAYELDFLAKVVLNTSADGTVPFYLRPAYDGYEQNVPLEGVQGRVLFNKSRGPYRAETLYTAGVLAMACNSPLFVRYLPAKVETYRRAALRAFAGFVKHYADDSFWQPDAHPYDNFVGGKHPWSDEMLLAAASLFQLTGKNEYLDWLLRELPEDLNATKLWYWNLEGPWLAAYVSIAANSRKEVPLEVKARAARAIVAWADSLNGPENEPNFRPFGMPLMNAVKDRVGWYFSASMAGFPLALAYGVTGQSRYRDDLVRTWNYLLGGNPLSRSFVTGLGRPERRPRWMVHEIAQVQWMKYRAGDPSGWSEMPPGLLAADVQQGEYEYFFDDARNKPRKAAKYPSNDRYPPLYRYHDSWTTQDESAVNVMGRSAASVVPLVRAPFTLQIPLEVLDAAELKHETPPALSATSASPKGAPSSDWKNLKMRSTGCGCGSASAAHYSMAPFAVLALAWSARRARRRR